MTRKNAAGSGILTEADDAPELTEAFFARATLRDGATMVQAVEDALDRGDAPADATGQPPRP
jgi:hypothetical protein